MLLQRIVLADAHLIPIQSLNTHKINISVVNSSLRERKVLYLVRYEYQNTLIEPLNIRNTRGKNIVKTFSLNAY